MPTILDVKENSISQDAVPHTLAGFKGRFFVEEGRQPTEQEIFNAGMMAGRDLYRPILVKLVKELVDTGIERII